MSPVLHPTSLVELVEAVRSAARVVPVGAGTKSRLSAVEGVRISTTRLAGIVEYEPDEFTFTALAGTPLRDLVAALAARGQYLPFDPPLLDAGATLGGTVAAGLSGPGRFRFGGIRDFILGVRFVDGAGRLLRLGGKVVKNAAGFDLPKFFCGSLGRFGVLGEVTFKVFPRPPATRTLRLWAKTPEERLRILVGAARSRWEADALEGPYGCCDVLMRLAGPESAVEEIAREVLTHFSGEVISEAASIWSDLQEFRWAHADGVLVKVPVSPGATPELHRELMSLPGARWHLGAGGNVAFVSLSSGESVAALEAVLTGMNQEGLCLWGDGPLWLSRKPRPAIESAVKRALDPPNRFPPLDD